MWQTTRGRLATWLLVCAAGCQGGGEDGYWKASSLTLVGLGDGGAETVVTPTSAPLSMIADYTFASGGAATGQLAAQSAATFAGKFALVKSGMGWLVALQPLDAVVQVAGDKWVLQSSPGGTSVFVATVAGDSLVLALDPTDARNTDGGGDVRRIEATRMPAPPSAMVGNWQMTELQVAGLSLPAGQCVGDGMGNWLSIELAMSVDARHVMTQTVTTTNYADARCIPGRVDVDHVEGIIEESPGSVEMVLHTIGGGDESDAVWTLTQEPGSSIQFARTTCQPTEHCNAVPTAATFKKVD